MIKIALIDDHVVVRSGFAQLLTLEPDITIAGQYASAAEAWPALTRPDIDVVIMDISMPDENGLQLLARLRERKTAFRTIILSIYDTPAFVQSALDAGASAYPPNAAARKSWFRRCVPCIRVAAICVRMPCARCVSHHRKTGRWKS